MYSASPSQFSPRKGHSPEGMNYVLFQKNPLIKASCLKDTITVEKSK